MKTRTTIKFIVVLQAYVCSTKFKIIVGVDSLMALSVCYFPNSKKMNCI